MVVVVVVVDHQGVVPFFWGVSIISNSIYLCARIYFAGGVITSFLDSIYNCFIISLLFVVKKHLGLIYSRKILRGTIHSSSCGTI